MSVSEAGGAHLLIQVTPPPCTPGLRWGWPCHLAPEGGGGGGGIGGWGDVGLWRCVEVGGWGMVEWLNGVIGKNVKCWGWETIEWKGIAELQNSRMVEKCDCGIAK